MRYEDLRIKREYIGKYIQDGNKNIELTDDLSTSTKRYIYNMVTKSIFDIFIEDIVVVIEDKMISVEEPKVEVKKRGRKVKQK